MNVLITGFDPFGGEPINPAWEAVKAMKDEIAGATITKLQIPTVVAKSIAKVHEKMLELRPDIVISIGQAGGRFGVTPERVAINVTDARIPDNEGNQPIDEPIFADGDAAYFSNLPVKAMVQEIRNAGYPLPSPTPQEPISATMSCMEFYTISKRNFQMYAVALSTFRMPFPRLSINRRPRLWPLRILRLHWKRL